MVLGEASLAGHQRDKPGFCEERTGYALLLPQERELPLSSPTRIPKDQFSAAPKKETNSEESINTKQNVGDASCSPPERVPIAEMSQQAGRSRKASPRKQAVG